MIARITGKVIEKGSNYILLENSGLTYQVFLPVMTMQRLAEIINEDGCISLITYHYFHTEPSKSIPVLIGFLNEIEREFFESFITVSGIGPKGALRALNQPISLIAKAIDEADMNFLRTLPGIGGQRAREIVAKLQNKVGKFGLIKDDHVKETGIPKDIEDEALSVLMQLGYKKIEGTAMLKKALENAKDITTTEELLNEVYKQKRQK